MTCTVTGTEPDSILYPLPSAVALTLQQQALTRVACLDTKLLSPHCICGGAIPAVCPSHTDCEGVQTTFHSQTDGGGVLDGLLGTRPLHPEFSTPAPELHTLQPTPDSAAAEFCWTASAHLQVKQGAPDNIHRSGFVLSGGLPTPSPGFKRPVLYSNTSGAAKSEISTPSSHLQQGTAGLQPTQLTQPNLKPYRCFETSSWSSLR